MASEFIYTLIRFGFLVLLWIFVFAALAVLRRDAFGHAAASRRGRRKARKKILAARSHSGAPSLLVVTGGPEAGTEMPLGTSAVRVGRSSACSLVLNDSYASSQHARFYKSDGDWYVEDLHSTNGTYVDGERLTGSRRLGPGVQVRIGQTTMELTR